MPAWCRAISSTKNWSLSPTSSSLRAMMLFPAIDLKDGACVRLYKGDMDAATVYANDAAAQAKRFEEAGFRYLHVVDLNGAGSGASANRPTVERILKSVGMPVQLGGGIRDRAAIE